MHHHTWLIFVSLVEMGFCHVGQAGLELLGSRDLPALASQSAGITSVSQDRKSTRLNSSHLVISYAVFCLKKKINTHPRVERGRYLPMRIVPFIGPTNSAQRLPRTLRFYFFSVFLLFLRFTLFYSSFQILP